MTAPQFKFRAKLEGGHTRVVVFVRNPPGETWQNCGDFHIDANQWPTLAAILERGRGKPSNCEIDDRCW